MYFCASGLSLLIQRAFCEHGIESLYHFSEYLSEPVHHGPWNLLWFFCVTMRHVSGAPGPLYGYCCIAEVSGGQCWQCGSSYMTHCIFVKYLTPRTWVCLILNTCSSENTGHKTKEQKPTIKDDIFQLELQKTYPQSKMTLTDANRH